MAEQLLNSGTGEFEVGAGDYSYTVTDANGCEATTSVSVGEPSLLEASSSAGEISCNGGTTTVTVSASGGTPPYSGTGEFEVGAGDYSYTVTDANGCEATTSVSVSEPSLLEASSSAGEILCNGGTTTVTVSASGGTPPYSGTGEFTVSAGDYSFTVTDANGCEATVSGNVSEPSLLEASSSAGEISCHGGTTTVVVSATGGTPPYSGTGEFEVGAGDYSYTVTDANGCEATTSVSVSEPDQLEASSSAGEILCNGGTTTVTVSATGGTPPYSGTGEFEVGAGDYSYTVTDANGCEATTSVSVSEPDQLEASSSAGEILCNGGTTTVTVSATGGTPPYSGTGEFEVGAGDYSYTVTDANGCEATTSVSVSEPEVLVAASSSIGPILCHGGTTTLVISATGGTAPYSGTGEFEVGAGDYSYTVTDANGCEATTSISVGEPDLLAASSSAGEILCHGGSTTVSVSASGGTPPYSGTGDFTVGAGDHTFTVTDANGCEATTSVSVSEPDAINVSVVGTNIFPSGSGSATAQVSGGTGDYSYLWSPGGQTTSSIDNLAPGTYCVTVTDANGCSSDPACYEVQMCLGAGGGHTLGFWSNPNGQALITNAFIAQLNLLSLRNANGSNFDMLGTLSANKKAFKTWLLSATAVNMSYMLSAQLSATQLSVLVGNVNGSALIYAPGTTSANAIGLATVNAIIAEANAILLANGVINAASPIRVYAEAVKNALNNSNNNLNFLVPCEGDKADYFETAEGADAIPTPESDMTIYPNPSNGILTVKYPVEDATSSTDLYIYDLSGKQVYAQKLDNAASSVVLDLQSDLQNAGSGFYFVRVINGNYVFNKKLSFINQ